MVSSKRQLNKLANMENVYMTLTISRAIKYFLRNWRKHMYREVRKAKEKENKRGRRERENVKSDSMSRHLILHLTANNFINNRR